MASSSIGWRELPYARAPFALDGQGLLVEEVIWDKPPRIGTTRLISGVRTEREMMRGEECEIIGLMSDPTLAELRQRSLLILPGTHCKHVWIENERVINFRTYMTGELFELLARHSILRASVDLSLCTEGLRTDSDRAAFTQGVLWAKEHGSPGSLFRVRTRAVLDGAPAHENTWFLSGLLIGAELTEVCRSVTDRPIILAAPAQFSELYSLASRTIASTTTQYIVVPPNELEAALVTAHAMVCASALHGRVGTSIAQNTER
jgi:2-dehydro-3-deoxygalactonokinase